MWQEVPDSTGKVYYYNSETGESTWEKPEELFTDFERALLKTNWKEYTAEGGHKYYFNAVTQESVWSIPEEVDKLLKATQPVNPRSAVSTNPASSSSIGGSVQSQTTEAVLETSTKDVTDLFREALESAGVEVDSEWDQCLEKLVVQSGYWAVTNPVQRKRYFEAFKQEKEKSRVVQARKLQVKLHADVANDLKKIKTIKYTTRWRSFVASHPGFIKKYMSDELFSFLGKINDEDYILKEIRYAYEQHLNSLRAVHSKSQELVRSRDLEELDRNLTRLKIDWNTKWTTVKHHLEEEGVTKTLPRLHMLDFLIRFEEIAKELEREKFNERQRERKLDLRNERKVRMAAVNLFNELHSQGKIRADTKWAKLVEEFKTDERFYSLCYQRSGSTPLELFWDIKEEEKQKLRLQKESIVDIFTVNHINFKTNMMPLQEFEKFISENLPGIDKYNLNLIHDQLIQEAQSKIRERELDDDRDRYSKERRRRRAEEEFWFALKSLEPPIKSFDSWADVIPRVSSLPEYKELHSEDRNAVFNRFISRLKDRERDYSRQLDRARSNRDYDHSLGKRDSRGAAPASAPAPTVPYRNERGRGNDFGPYLEY